MRLRDFFQVDSILCGFEAEGRDEAIRVLAASLAERGLIENDAAVVDRLTETEDRHTTVIGNGVAIPHATVDGLSRTLLMVAVAKHPIQFGPVEVELCSVFFVLLSPLNRGGEHVRLLARIARLASNPVTVEQLRTADSEAILLQAVGSLDEPR